MTSESLQTYQTDRKHDTKMKESHSNEELVGKGMTPSDVLIAKVREKFKSESHKLLVSSLAKNIKTKKNHGFMLLLLDNIRRCLLDKQDTHEMKIPISLPLVLWSESTISDYFPFYWFSLLYAIPWFARIKNVWSKIAVSERRKYALSFLLLSIFIQKILHQPQSNHLQCPHILSFL